MVIGKSSAVVIAHSVQQLLHLQCSSYCTRSAVVIALMMHSLLTSII